MPGDTSRRRRTSVVRPIGSYKDRMVLAMIEGAELVVAWGKVQRGVPTAVVFQA
jgi:hypothetical protein